MSPTIIYTSNFSQVQLNIIFVAFLARYWSIFVVTTCAYYHCSGIWSYAWSIYALIWSIIDINVWRIVVTITTVHLMVSIWPVRFFAFGYVHTHHTPWWSDGLLLAGLTSLENSLREIISHYLEYYCQFSQWSKE